jgi:alpha-mannosidase
MCVLESKLMIPCRLIPKNKINEINHSFPQFKIDSAPSVVLDTIKKAEDSNDVIVRIFEAYGGHARARLIR